MKNMRRVLLVALAVIMMASLFAGCGKKQVSYVKLEESLAPEEYGVGFQKDAIALGNEVQRILDEMIADGKAAEISTKWFGEDIMIKDGEFTRQAEVLESDKSLENVKNKGKLVMGLDDKFPPMGFRDEENNIVGFDIDLATEVCKRMGVELVLQTIDWKSKEMELNAGKIDCAWNGLTITDQRVAAMYIPKPYIANKQVIVVADNSGITTIDDLKGKVVGLQSGSSALDALEAHPIRGEVKEVVEYDENVTAYSDLKIGRIDAFVVDVIVADYLLSQDAKKAE
nr:transporter substrate-binding domain-containing protein [bacterium]